MGLTRLTDIHDEGVRSYASPARSSEVSPSCSPRSTVSWPTQRRTAVSVSSERISQPRNEGLLFHKRNRGGSEPQNSQSSNVPVASFAGQTRLAQCAHSRNVPHVKAKPEREASPRQPQAEFVPQAPKDIVDRRCPSGTGGRSSGVPERSLKRGRRVCGGSGCGGGSGARTLRRLG